MSEEVLSSRPSGTSTAPVELRVRAHFGQLPLLRATAETVTVLADFDLDAVSDVKMAVDEVCSELIRVAVGDADVVCHYDLVGDTLHVRIHTVTVTDAVPDEEGFGWHVVRTLTDSPAATHDAIADTAARYRTTIVFSRSRRGGD